MIPGIWKEITDYRDSIEAIQNRPQISFDVCG